MTIDIWSDVMCPFCYIGKRNLEEALRQFAHKDEVAIQWHSFQLDPDAKAEPGKDVYTYLAERKGQTRAWAEQMHLQVTATARAAGLTYNFDKTIIANSQNAHRLIQMAKRYGNDDATEELLFKAYFTEGLDISNREVLHKIAIQAGLDSTETDTMLDSNAYADEVNADVVAAEEMGISGVPFFVINKQYGISGAQPPAHFLSGLQQAWHEETISKTGAATAGADDMCADGSCNIETN